MIYFLPAALLIMLPSMGSHPMKTSKLLTIDYGNARVSCEIKSKKILEVSKEERELHPDSCTSRTYIYASLVVENVSNSDVVFDLRELILDLDGHKSDGVYIDNIADFLIRPIPVKAGARYKAKIYWTVPEGVKDSLLDKAKLIVSDTAREKSKP